jgi:NAD+ kinase
MKTVALLVHPSREEAITTAGEAGAWLSANGYGVRVLNLKELNKVSENGEVCDLADVDISNVDLAVSLGGDGTFLRLVPLAWKADVPILGVNFGRLGYLLEVAPDRLSDALKMHFGGDAVLEERVMLSVSTDLAAQSPSQLDHPLTHWLALNETVLEKTVFGHTVRLAMSIDEEEFITYSSDGLIVATPTGSTAYNLSAGGPVLSTAMEAIVVTPVAPHLSFDRSIVLARDQAVTVQIEEERPAALVIDGKEVGRLMPGGKVTCRLASRPLRLVTLGIRGFGSTLRQTVVPH